MLVVIDAKPKDLGLPTEAYYSVEEVHDVRYHLTAWELALFTKNNNLSFEFQKFVNYVKNKAALKLFL